jgi:pyrroline-5-carboxylate reductase
MGSVLIKSLSSYLTQKYQKEYSTVNFKDIFYMYDPVTNKKEEFQNLGFKNYTENEAEVFENSKINFICTKPDIVYEVLNKTMKYSSKESMVISIAAGISIDYIENLYQYDKKEGENHVEMPKIVRVMTNHLCGINQGGSVYSMNSSCESVDEDIVNCFFKNVGIVKKVDESLMNAFTALTGSGPAFVYQFIESLVDASLRNGIDVTTARQFAIQNVLGAALFMNSSNDKNPNNIQYIVTTPKGTTIAGLNALNKHRFKYAVDQAITAASDRGKEIELEKMKYLRKKQRLLRNLRSIDGKFKL